MDNNEKLTFYGCVGHFGRIIQFVIRGTGPGQIGRGSCCRQCGCGSSRGCLWIRGRIRFQLGAFGHGKSQSVVVVIMMLVVVMMLSLGIQRNVTLVPIAGTQPEWREHLDAADDVRKRLAVLA